LRNRLKRSPSKKKDKISPKNRTLNPYERTANEVLKNAHRKLSTNEVAQYGEMSWQTAKKHLNNLSRKRKSIHTEKKGKTKLWFFKKG
jgi:response regulator of citrate/malate metabolism